jgi:hypothetical protein
VSGTGKRGEVTGTKVDRAGRWIGRIHLGVVQARWWRRPGTIHMRLASVGYRWCLRWLSLMVCPSLKPMLDARPTSAGITRCEPQTNTISRVAFLAAEHHSSTPSWARRRAL